MRQKSLRCVITFHTTSQAIAAERFCKEYGIAGRLIPVPREITSGCGMAWSAPAEEAERVRQAMSEHEIVYEGTYQLMI